MQVILNVLASAKKVTLERLQKMLTLFGLHLNPKYDRSEDELLEYLDVLVERGVLLCEGSQYSKAE
jgi:Anaphase promoting complex (APC) subunit 2